MFLTNADSVTCLLLMFYEPVFQVFDMISTNCPSNFMEFSPGKKDLSEKGMKKWKRTVEKTAFYKY